MNRVLFKSESVEWQTPQAVYDKMNAEFCFDFDPCPIGGSADGTARLFCDWKGRRVYCNPPYGPGIRKFLERALEAELAVYLLPARTDTKWFHDLVLPSAREIRFIKGRLAFGNYCASCKRKHHGEWPKGHRRGNAPFPSMIVVFAQKCDKCGKPPNDWKHDESAFFRHDYVGSRP